MSCNVEVLWCFHTLTESCKTFYTLKDHQVLTMAKLWFHDGQQQVSCVESHVVPAIFQLLHIPFSVLLNAMFDGFCCFSLCKLKETYQSTMWITNFILHSFCKYGHEIMIFQWITFDSPHQGLTDEVADYASFCWYYQYFCFNCSCHLQVVDIHFCWYHYSHSTLYLICMIIMLVFPWWVLDVLSSSTILIINNWRFSIMMLIILIKAHQATGSEWSSFMAEKIDDLACAFSNFSSIFSFSAWFWIIYFFSRNFASIINSAILHLYSISRCIYFDAIDIYRDPILTAKIHSRQKLRATYFKCYKWIRVSKQTRGCSFWLRWRNKSL